MLVVRPFCKHENFTLVLITYAVHHSFMRKLFISMNYSRFYMYTIVNDTQVVYVSYEHVKWDPQTYTQIPMKAVKDKQPHRMFPFPQHWCCIKYAVEVA